MAAAGSPDRVNGRAREPGPVETDAVVESDLVGAGPIPPAPAGEEPLLVGQSLTDVESADDPLPGCRTHRLQAVGIQFAYVARECDKVAWPGPITGRTRQLAGQRWR